MASLTAHLKDFCWLQSSGGRSSQKGAKSQIILVGRDGKAPGTLTKKIPGSLKKKFKDGQAVVQWADRQGSLWLLQTHIVENKSHYGQFSPSPYAMARDLVGTCIRQILQESPAQVSFEYIGSIDEEFLGACVGLEMGRYSFKNQWPKVKSSKPTLKIKSTLKNQKALLTQAAQLGESVNLARFLVDLPPNALQPESYAQFLKSHFSGRPKTKVNLWNPSRLEKENMGLHLAVGQGAAQGPHLVHVEYRGGGKEKPYAFVGKGITFDSGGLDIKPGPNMRLMKKDMGGSATVAGLAHWVVQSKLKLNCDFYFAIAENAVSRDSFRPSDVLVSRKGLTVEIDNTDAEGRLVLADALTVAAEKKPQFIVDVATLTGAIKFGLGATMPGLFSNSDNFAETLIRSGQSRGDLFWRMPLIPEERSRLQSDVADVVNSTNGFGGAVTAALFLEMFTSGIPWAHFDIYAWTERAKGPFGASGGTGQVVQALSHFLAQQIEM